MGATCIASAATSCYIDITNHSARYSTTSAVFQRFTFATPSSYFRVIAARQKRS